MRPLPRHEGLVVPLWRPNVDTDQIIPKQFLKRIERSGFGQFLFYDWRFREDGSPNPEFILNDPRFAGASILVAGPNFGSGSSREHAPWALEDYGFRVIIAPSFADIFYQNCLKNGLLPLRVPYDLAERMARRAERGDYRLTVDVENLVVTDAEGLRFPFDLDPFTQETLVKGLDDIARTLAKEDLIRAYEARHG
ncbi:MAG: 3-isopropylmalate dehydratase small subunit [Actinomycetia bacterium]|nr:3-isopropylmalate dehydratase small subunit [Actinomycetes bacterium]